MRNDKNKEIILYWKEKYLETIGIPYIVNWTKHGNIIKQLLKQFDDVSLIKELIDYMFTLNLEYYDISFLLGYQVNKWIQTLVKEQQEKQELRRIAKIIKEKIKCQQEEENKSDRKNN